MRIRWRNLELPTQVLIEAESRIDNYAKFVVEPFERGFGTTVGNSLRRILLSSLEGTAVTSVRIKNVAHEFVAINGVLEDVTEIILNIKKLRIKLHGDGPATVTLSKSGKGDVTAADITCDHNTEIVEGGHYICNLTNATTKFEAEMTIRRGRGYVTADENAEGNREVGVIYVDSSFSPITRVRYNTENTRVGKMTNYDKLILEVWTDGTITPELGVVEASKILRKHLNPFVQISARGPELSADMRFGTDLSGDDQTEIRRKLALPITELELPVRATNCFEAENINTIGDLVIRQESDILRIRNFGKTSMKDVKKKLQEMGLSFGMPKDLLV